MLPLTLSHSLEPAGGLAPPSPRYGLEILLLNYTGRTNSGERGWSCTTEMAVLQTAAFTASPRAPERPDGGPGCLPTRAGPAPAAPGWEAGPACTPIKPFKYWMRDSELHGAYEFMRLARRLRLPSRQGRPWEPGPIARSDACPAGLRRFHHASGEEFWRKRRVLPPHRPDSGRPG